MEISVSFEAYVQRLTDLELDQLMFDAAKEELSRWQLRKAERPAEPAR